MSKRHIFYFKKTDMDLPHTLGFFPSVEEAYKHYKSRFGDSSGIIIKAKIYYVKNDVIKEA